MILQGFIISILITTLMILKQALNWLMLCKKMSSLKVL